VLLKRTESIVISSLMFMTETCNILSSNWKAVQEFLQQY